MDLTLLIISIILAINYLSFLIMVYRGLNYLMGSEKHIPNEEIENMFISVIIPFRNESETILKSLCSITHQAYPGEKYEVLYIDDFSNDDSPEKICKAEKPENIRVIAVPHSDSEKAFKKRAIDFAINQCRGEIIVLTDCDCEHNPNWLSSMVNKFDDDTALVSGPVTFIENNSMFGKLQKIEFAGLILTGAGLIGINKPTICNSANLSFRKSVFLEIGGYDDNLNLSSGDDEFLMQKINKETRYKIKFNTDKESVVFTNPNENLKLFLEQRKRWASKSLFYKNKKLVLKLILIYLFYLSLPVTLLAGIFYLRTYLVVFSIFFILKVIPEFSILLKGKKFLYKKIKFSTFFLAELVQVPYILISGFTGLFGNFMWKNRKLKR